MKVIVVLVIILALLLLMRLITRRKALNLTFTLPVMKNGQMPADEAGAPDAIAKKMEADAERLGIHVSEEDVKALADEIRGAEDEAKRTGRAETSFTLGSAGRATPNAGAAAPEPTATPAGHVDARRRGLGDARPSHRRRRGSRDARCRRSRWSDASGHPPDRGSRGPVGMAREGGATAGVDRRR